MKSNNSVISSGTINESSKNSRLDDNKSISLNSLKRKIEIIVSDYIVTYFNIIDLDKPDEIITDENEKKRFLMQQKQTSIPKIRERIFALLGITKKGPLIYKMLFIS